MSSDTETYAVGDDLAFRHYNNFGGVPPYSLHKIERITPTGLMVCGGYKVTPDLRIRGEYSLTDCVGRPTPEIIEELTRWQIVNRLSRMKWDTLTTDALKAVADIIGKEKMRC
jgi:hypothetical protein